MAHSPSDDASRRRDRNAFRIPGGCVCQVQVASPVYFQHRGHGSFSVSEPETASARILLKSESGASLQRGLHIASVRNYPASISGSTTYYRRRWKHALGARKARAGTEAAE